MQYSVIKDSHKEYKQIYQQWHFSLEIQCRVRKENVKRKIFTKYLT